MVIFTSCKVDSITGMPSPIYIPADQVGPVGCVAHKRVDLECPVRGQEVLQDGGVPCVLWSIGQVTSSQPGKYLC